jgi:hypothetical protein
MDSKPNWPNRQLADGYNFVDAASAGFDGAVLTILNLVVNSFECPAIMFISTVDCESKNPSMLVTGSFNRIGEYLFVFPFVKPATVRICRTDLYFLLWVAA